MNYSNKKMLAILLACVVASNPILAMQKDDNPGYGKNSTTSLSSATGADLLKVREERIKEREAQKAAYIKKEEEEAKRLSQSAQQLQQKPTVVAQLGKPKTEANLLTQTVAVQNHEESKEPPKTTQGLPTQTNPGTSSAFQPSQNSKMDQKTLSLLQARVKEEVENNVLMGQEIEVLNQSLAIEVARTKTLNDSLNTLDKKHKMLISQLKGAGATIDKNALSQKKQADVRRARAKVVASITDSNLDKDQKLALFAETPDFFGDVSQDSEDEFSSVKEKLLRQNAKLFRPDLLNAKKLKLPNAINSVKDTISGELSDEQINSIKQASEHDQNLQEVFSNIGADFAKPMVDMIGEVRAAADSLINPYKSKAKTLQDKLESLTVKELAQMQEPMSEDEPFDQEALNAMLLEYKEENEDESVSNKSGLSKKQWIRKLKEIRSDNDTQTKAEKAYKNLKTLLAEKPGLEIKLDEPINLEKKTLNEWIKKAKEKLEPIKERLSKIEGKSKSRAKAVEAINRLQSLVENTPALAGLLEKEPGIDLETSTKKEINGWIEKFKERIQEELTKTASKKK